MTVIPNFILKRMYVSGSLRRVPEGIAFDIHNNLGPGSITGLNHVQLGDTTFPGDEIIVETNGVRRMGDTLSEQQPIVVTLGQSATLIIQNAELQNGKYDLSMDLLSREGGHVVLSVSDTLQ